LDDLTAIHRVDWRAPPCGRGLEAVVAHITGIELAGDGCALVDVRRSGGETRIAAFRIVEAADRLDPDDVPAEPTSLLEHVRRARLELHLPRRARVVAWGMTDDPSIDGSVMRAAAGPARDAGFDIETVLTPAQALAQLARERQAPGSDAAAWLTVNRTRAAVAVVHGSDRLFSREFTWSFDQRFRAHDRLLHRYLLVAHLASELRHAMDVVKERHGVAVGAIVTCGNMPDLRSLTMPLIEELDVEVETLDSTDGLLLDDAAGVASVTDVIAALRLATAATSLEPASRQRVPAIAFARAAVFAGLAVALGWWAYASWGASRFTVASAPPAAAPSQPTLQGEPPPARAVRPDAAPARAEGPPATAGKPDPAATGTTGTAAREDEPPEIDSMAPPPLQEARPVVSSILISPDRRLAIVDGAIVREGDEVGSRVVLSIESAGVLFREPSGRRIRVPVRPRSSRNR
jgi:hypothetical protein